VVGPLIYFFAREAKGHGVPEVMAAVALRGGVIRSRVVAIKALASAVSIGSGGSVGREGPIVQIGSALGSTLGQLLRVPASQLRTIVGCGAAAGESATFNAPIAGALFAGEVILGQFGVVSFSAIVISSVVATVISRAFIGDFPAFLVPAFHLQHRWEGGGEAETETRVIALPQENGVFGVGDVHGKIAAGKGFVLIASAVPISVDIDTAATKAHAAHQHRAPSVRSEVSFCSVHPSGPQVMKGMIRITGTFINPGIEDSGFQIHIVDVGAIHVGGICQPLEVRQEVLGDVGPDLISSLKGPVLSSVHGKLGAISGQ